MVPFDDFSVTLADFTPGLSDFWTGHPTGFCGTYLRNYYELHDT